MVHHGLFPVAFVRSVWSWNTGHLVVWAFCLFACRSLYSMNCDTVSHMILHTHRCPSAWTHPALLGGGCEVFPDQPGVPLVCPRGLLPTCTAGPCLEPLPRPPQLPSMRSRDSGTRDPGPRTRDLGPGTWGLGPGTRDLGPRTWARSFYRFIALQPLHTYLLSDPRPTWLPDICVFSMLHMLSSIITAALAPPPPPCSLKRQDATVALVL